MKSILFLLLFLPFCTQAQIIVTVAGIGEEGYTGNGGPATNAKLNTPHGVTIDNEGNLLICDVANHRIRKVSPPYGGNITTIAGSDLGDSGDGSSAIYARFSAVYDIAVDKVGNMYLADAFSNKIRKITTDGIIHTIVGTGIAGYNGDGITAATAQLNGPFSISIDDTGNLYIGDLFNFRIRKVDTFGIIHTLIGNGSSGFSFDGNNADTSSINAPNCVRFYKDNCLYFTDNNRIRRINPYGIISTVAGNGGGGYDGDGGLAAMAQLGGGIAGIAFDTSGCIYITDSDKGRVRKVNFEGVINKVAGIGGSSYSGDGGDPLFAFLNLPCGIAVATSGDVFIGDMGNNRVRMISSHIVGIPEVINNSNNLIISPNPAKEQCTILVNGTTAQQVTIVITDVAGREVHRCMGTTRQPITIATCWQPGIYTVSASTATEQHTTSIVVQ